MHVFAPSFSSWCHLVDFLIRVNAPFDLVELKGAHFGFFVLLAKERATSFVYVIVFL